MNGRLSRGHNSQVVAYKIRLEGQGGLVERNQKQNF